MRFFLRNVCRRFLLLSFIMLFISIGLFGQSGLPQTTEYVPNRVIVKFKSTGDAGAITQFKAQLKTDFGVSKTKRLGKIDVEVWDFNDGNVQDVIARWKNDPRIKYIEPDYIVHGSVTPNDPLFSSLWGMAKIQAEQAWNTTTGTNVIVGVIDTGVDYLHPDLATNMWTNPGEIPGNSIDDDNNGYIDDVHGYDFVNNDGDPMDDHYHGTHVAGTIAAAGNNGVGVVGVNWTARVMALKFIGSNNSGTTSNAIRAVLYSTQMGAQLTNNSWGGGGYSQALYDAIQAAGASNKLFVASAGNDNLNTDTYPQYAYPSSYNLDNIISVAATDVNDLRASFSNYGATTVDLGAPGVGILSTYPTWHASGPYFSISGTSMASPHVAGVAALILSQHPTFSSEDVKDIILNSVDLVASLNGKTVTGGRLNAYKAITLSQTWTPYLPPAMSLTPTVISVSLDPDANTVQPLSISNQAGSRKLYWNISAPSCSWVSLSSSSGIILGGATSQPQVTINAFGLDPGNYQCTFNVNSNDANNAQVQVMVNLIVNYQPPPVVSVAPASLAFSLVTGESADSIVTISNTASAGSRNLHWNAVKQGPGPWLTLNNNSGVTAAGASHQMHVLSNAAGLSAGVYNETINITTNDPNNVLIQIPIQLTVSSVPVSGQKIYTFGGNDNTIRRANLDGSNAATPFTGLTSPVKGVVDVVNRKLYWAEVGPVRIKRADLDGSNNETLVTSITGAIIAMDLDVANNHMYFFHQVAGQVYRLSRANLDGSNLITVGDVPGWNFSGLNIDHTNNKIYWYMLGASATGGHAETGIWRSNLDLTNKEHLVTPPADAGGGLSIDFAGGKMYWGESFPRDVIRTATLDGNNQADVLVGYEAGDVAVDPIHGKIYWTHQICVGFDCTYDTKRADLNGSNIQSLGLNAYRLALDLSGASQLTINDVTKNEGISGPTTYTFTVSLSSPAPAGGVTFDIATANNTATTANNDYVQKSLTGQTIPQGSSTYTFDVVVNGDVSIEPDESFFVNVINVTGATLSDGQGEGTITNDDVPATTSLTLVSNNSNPSCIGSVPSFTATLLQTTTPVGPIAGQTITFQLINSSAVVVSTQSGVTNMSGQTTVVFAPNSSPGTYTVQASFAGSASYTGSTSQILTYVVNPSPTVICPANITVSNDANQCGAVVTYAATASNSCPATISYSHAPGSFFPVGTTTVTATATAPTGISNSCTFTVTVVDAQNPLISCPANITVNNAANQCGANVSYSATATDNCSGTTISYSPTSGSFFPIGTATVTATATDAAGNTSSCTFTVTVADAQSPTITCPANITVNNTANQCGAIVTYAATAIDNCTGVSVSYSPASGSFFSIGTATVTATVTDAAGNIASCAFTVTVVDAQAPTVSCPLNITQSLGNNSCSKQISTANPVFGDNCGVTTLTWVMTGATTGNSPATGIRYVGTKTFNAGTTTVAYTARDAAGNMSSCSFTIRLTETVRPGIACPPDKTANAENGLCYKSQVNLGTPETSDNCCVATVTNDAPAQYPVGITWVTWTVSDHSGNTRTCKQKVTVVDTEKPNISCPGNVSLITGNSCAINVTTQQPVYSDNCTVLKLTWNMTGATTGSSAGNGINYVGTKSFNPGITVVKYTVTDASGNSRVCSFSVTITDNQPPLVVCPPAQIRCKVDGNNYTIPPMTRSDNCGIGSSSYRVTGATTRNGSGVNASGNFKLGVSTITWTVTDVNGNISSCTTQVTILPASNCTITRVQGPSETTTEETTDHKFNAGKSSKLEVIATPNPTEYYFNLLVRGPGKETIEIRMYDMMGKLVQQQRGAAGQTYRFGEQAVSGMYIIEVRQGGEKAIIKVVKQ